MALTTTTATAAIAASDTSISVASSTGFAANSLLKVGPEIMRVTAGYVGGTLTVPVLRGLSGSATQAHAITSNVVVGLPSEFGDTAPAGAVSYPAVRVRQVRSYNAAGAIALQVPGNDMLAIINGVVARAMTLAAPSTDMDGDEMVVCSNGKAAHTVTIAGGIGAAGTGYTVATFTTGAQQTLALLAINGAWVQKQSHFSGTLTAILIALA